MGFLRAQASFSLRSAQKRGVWQFVGRTLNLATEGLHDHLVAKGDPHHLRKRGIEHP